jgi:hypothetical protein
MGFVIQSTTGDSLPQEAMRSIVEAVDTWRGQGEAFVVFHDAPPYEIDSVHPTNAAAQAAAKAGRGLNYFGPVAPRPNVNTPIIIVKVTGCNLLPITHAVSRIVLLDAKNKEVAQFTANPKGALPDPASDIEAIFVTASGIDKFMIPFLTRMFGAEYAAAKRGEWIKE